MASLRSIPEIEALPFVHAITPVARSRRGPRPLDPGVAPSPSWRRAGVPFDYGPSFNQLDEIGVIEAHAEGRLQSLLDQAGVKFEDDPSIDARSFLPNWLQPR